MLLGGWFAKWLAYREVIQAEERRTFATLEKINCYLIEGKVVTDFGTLSTLVYLALSKVEEPSFDRKTSIFDTNDQILYLAANYTKQGSIDSFSTSRNTS